jgi:hypothetical protein
VNDPRSRGYPRLATFLDSDESFSVFRRFGYIQSRLLLEKQDDLRILEEELDILDEVHLAHHGYSLTTRREIDEDKYQSRRDLLQALEKKFCEYGRCDQQPVATSSLMKAANLLHSAHLLTALNKPTSRDHRSVENFMNNAQPIVPSEASFIYHKEDLITLRPGREQAWLETSIEMLLGKLDCAVTRVSWPRKRIFELHVLIDEVSLLRPGESHNLRKLTVLMGH